MYNAHKSLIFSVKSVFFTFLLSTVLLFNVANALDLDHQVKLGHIDDIQFNWQQITPHPTKNNHYYVFSNEGKIKKIVNGEIEKEPLLAVNSILNKESFQLTALTLHPNFALKDLPGYNTFYTAHIERFNDKERLIRLPKTPLANSQFDLVVYEWQLDLLGKAVNVETSREIIRIASPEQNFRIQQLSFNPYLKPWQDDFGDLFITLNQANSNKNLPLYSGAILRINPEKFGLRNYTVPNNNPFINEAEIDNEIIALGMNQAKKILWQKRNNKQWFVVQEQENTHNLTIVNFADDLRALTSKPLWQSKIHNNSFQVVWYEGRRINELLYKLITLELVNNQWYLTSLDITEEKSVNKTTLAKVPNAGKGAKLGLTITNQQELLLLNISDGIFSLVKGLEDGASKSEDTYIDPYEVTNYSDLYLWLGIIVGMILAIMIAIKIKNYDHEKALVRKHYNRFDFSNYGEQINLFKRHQKEAKVAINIADIVENKVRLNNEVICHISADQEKVFDLKAKNKMNDAIAQEQRIKMVDHRSRVIMVDITDKSGSTYHICLYARRGNQRYTRIHFQECLNMINLWCATLSETINPHHPKEE